MISERQRRKIRRALREMLQALDVPPIRYTYGQRNKARWFMPASLLHKMARG